MINAFFDKCIISYKKHYYRDSKKNKDSHKNIDTISIIALELANHTCDYVFYPKNLEWFEKIIGELKKRHW